MKLLFDHNLSPRLASRLVDIFPESVHVRDIGMEKASDSEIWAYAGTHEFVIVSKDADFQHRSLLYGPPPKFIWLRIGNGPVAVAESLLRSRSVVIHTFHQDPALGYLVLP